MPDIVKRIDNIVGEAKKEDLRNFIKDELGKGRTKPLVWNDVKKSFRNVKKKHFEKIWNELSESTVTGDVVQNKAKGHVDVIGPSKRTRNKKRWNYMFRGTDHGTFTIEANSKKAALSKIKKEWGINSIPSNLFIWEE